MLVITPRSSSHWTHKSSSHKPKPVPINSHGLSQCSGSLSKSPNRSWSLTAHSFVRASNELFKKCARNISSCTEILITNTIITALPLLFFLKDRVYGYACTCLCMRALVNVQRTEKHTEYNDPSLPALFSWVRSLTENGAGLAPSKSHRILPFSLLSFCLPVPTSTECYGCVDAQPCPESSTGAGDF